MSDYEGRLELTWTNKHLRLLAHEDGSYEWVQPSDYRVAEVRLLHDAATVGDVGNERAADNLLIRGDALNALTSLGRLPEFAEQTLRKVQLAYLDPPFNTQQSFLHYDDALEHSVWLAMIRDRLLQIRDMLAPTGSVWVHLDDSEVHRARCVMDEVFGPGSFVATIVWEKAPGPKGDTDISDSHDYILVYAKEAATWKDTRNLLVRSEAQLTRYANPDDDPRGSWRQGADGTAKSGNDALRYPITLPSGRIVTPPKGNYWRFTEETFELARDEGRVWFGRKGDSLPVIKTYLSEAKKGVVPRTWWPSNEVGSNQEARRDHLRRLFPDREPFATPKPERLLQRIIHIATNPGDLVLDCFVGSGTTAAVAQKMGRRWLAIEMEPATIRDFALPRLKLVVEGRDPDGATALTGWTGGGGFRVLDVAPSMYEADDGMVFLADWMTNGALAEATAAQLGFAYEEDPPFAGHKGRARLAVVDGVVNESVVRILVSALPEGERVVICGTGIDTEARPVLRELRPGSTLRKIPAALLDEYRSARQLSLIPDDADTNPTLNGTASLVTAGG
ncbi:MAG TPA: site-specific DNA-methyltransferase [Solirubrobacteraceae bacterium]|nr:site-specific DNA-methyltransferase [Solirubrobacteraceae bacterium]